jgi:ANTAR domain/GAF domain
MIVGVPVAEDRAVALWGRVAGHAAAADRRVSVADVCAVAVLAAGASGGWVIASGGAGGPDFVLCVTGAVGERLAELQLTLGEGPCHEVLATAAPVLAADLADEDCAGRWPAFAAEARRAGAQAVFAFPLTVGAVRAGVMGLYRGTPGPLQSRQLADGLILADAATVLLLGSTGHGPADGAGLDGQAPDLAAHRAEIDQATGMLTVQLGVGAAEAFARLRAYAYASDRRLAEVAADIVARRLRLSAVLPPDGAADFPPAR